MHRYFVIGQAVNWVSIYVVSHHKATLMFKNSPILQDTKIGGLAPTTTWVVIKFVTEITIRFETPFTSFSDAGHFMRKNKVVLISKGVNPAGSCISISQLELTNVEDDLV